ncbi:MAG: hypothetical protein EOP04_31175, partial [Proteobacteria bacterium]
MKSNVIKIARNHFDRIKVLLNAAGIKKKDIVKTMSAYYLLTIVGTILEGIGLVMLLGVFTGKSIKVLVAETVPIL